MTPSLKWNEASASAVKNRLESAYHDLRVPSYYLGYAAAFGAVAGPQFSDAYDRLLIYIEALQKVTSTAPNILTVFRRTLMPKIKNSDGSSELTMTSLTTSQRITPGLTGQDIYTDSYVPQIHLVGHNVHVKAAS